MKSRIILLLAIAVLTGCTHVSRKTNGVIVQTIGVGRWDTTDIRGWCIGITHWTRFDTSPETNAPVNTFLK